MEDRRIKGLGYEDTEVFCKVNIYGIDFEIVKIDLERIKYLKKDNKESIEELIRIILGEDSIEKLNEKRVKDGYGELQLTHELVILGYLMDEYRKSVANVQDNAAAEIIKMGNANRQERRQYNKQNSYKNRGYYGRNKRY